MEPGLDRGKALLEAVVFAAEHLLRGPVPSPVPDVLAMLAEATGSSRVTLVAARPDRTPECRRLEVRHQWAAAGLARIQPGVGGPPPYPERWREQMVAGAILHGAVADFPDDEQGLAAMDGMAAVALVPVTVGEHWYGHLQFGSPGTAPSWSEGELEGLLAAGGIVGAAIQHRQTVANLERRTAVLRAVSEAAPLLLTADDWRAVLPRVLELLRAATRARGAWALGQDPDRPDRQPVVIVEAVAPGAPAASLQGHRLELPVGALDRLAAGEVLRDEARSGDAHALHVTMASIGVVSWVVVPVVAGPSGACGGLGLDSEQERTWAEGEIEALRVTAGALAAAMRRDRPSPAVVVGPDHWLPTRPARLTGSSGGDLAPEAQRAQGGGHPCGGSGAMRDRVLLRRRPLAQRPPAGRLLERLEQRVVAEPAVSPQPGGDPPPAAPAPGQDPQPAPWARSRRAAPAPGRTRSGHLAAPPAGLASSREELRVVVGIGGLRTGVAPRVDAGPSAQRVHLETGVVGEGRQPGT